MLLALSLSLAPWGPVSMGTASVLGLAHFPCTPRLRPVLDGACAGAARPSQAEWHSVAWTAHVVFTIRSLADIWAASTFWVFMSNAAMNVGVQVPV